jgi:hypothetical protein
MWRSKCTTGPWPRPRRHDRLRSLLASIDVPTQVLVAVGPNKENRVPGLESHDISDVPAEVPPVVLWLPLIDRHDAVALGSAGTEQGATELERNQLGGPFVGAQQP